MSNNNRPHGMSQLDYLWTHFGTYEVSNETSQVPSENVILTEQALTNLIQESTNGGITALTYRQHPTKDNVMQLIGTSINGSELTVVEMPKEVHVQSFQRRRVTQIDKDNGCQFQLDSEVLSLVLTNGEEFLVNLSDIDLLLSSKDTSTVATDVTNGVIQSSLKIDERNNNISTVQIHTTGNGIYSDINISDEDTGIKIEKTDKGLSAYIPIGINKVRFQQLTLDQYLVLEPKDQSTFYLITDVPYIFFGGVRYGSGLETSDTPIVSLVYDADHMLLSYKKVGEDITQIHLGPADENTPGMMSTQSYVDLQNLKNTLGDLKDIPEYIEEQVGQLAYSLELGEQHNNTRPLRLIAKNGGILSSVDLDVENFLQEAENKIATAQDVIDSGETVVEGHQILVLTLTSGDKVYVDLNALVTAFTVSDTDTVNLNLNNNNFTANLKINGNEKIIHAGPNGIQSYWQVVQSDNTVTFYGLNQTLEYRLGQIIVPDVLQQYQFKGQITADDVIHYPPRTVDSIDYDYDTNPIIIGDPYIILGYGTNDVLHYDYISIKPLYKAIQLSQKENNTLTKDDNGLLYNEDKSVISGELEGGIITLHLGNDTTVLIPLPEATSESSGLLSAQDKSKLDILLSDGDGSISKIQSDLEKVASDVNNIGNVIIPEMNENTAKALDGKVDWDSEKKVITLPEDGSISALQPGEAGQPNPEGGTMIAQRKYEEKDAPTTEVGNTKNYLTLNSKDGKVQIDSTGGSEFMATETFVTNITNNKVDKEEGKSLVEDTLITKLEGLSDQSTIDQDISTAVDEAKEELQNSIDTTKQELQGNIDSVKSAIDNYTVNGHKISENPVLTKADVGLENVTNDAQIPLSQKGAVNGVATLDESGKVPSVQLPSFVDDVLEYDNLESFPETGESGKIYVTRDTNLEYRWSGTQYIQISKSVGLGETASTAYAGDKGKQVADRVSEVYSTNSVINGLSDVTFDSDNTEAQILSADNAIKTWDGSGATHDMKIPYATATKAGVMSAADKSKLDQLTEGLSDDTPSISEVVENINTISQSVTEIQEDITNIEGDITDIQGNITDIQGDVTGIKNSIGDTSSLTTEADTIVEAINEHETQINQLQSDLTQLDGKVVKQIKVGANEAINPVEGLVTIPVATTGADGAMSAADKTKLDLVVTDGDGTQFLSNDGTYKTITMNLSDDYTASIEVNDKLNPLPGDSMETAIGKLHKAILDNEDVTVSALANIQKVLGVINPNQTLPDLSDTNYLNGSTTFIECLKALDKALKTISEQANKITDLETRVKALEDALTLKTA